jgi:hypothetical protein
MKQVEAVQLVDRYVHERRRTDQRFVEWGLYFFVLTWITFGIYPTIMFYRRLDRADLFRDRRLNYYNAVIEASRQHADRSGQGDAVQDDLDDLHRFVTERFADEHRPIKAGLSVFLSFITLSIYGWISVHRLMRFWWQIQLTEQDFDEKISLIWTKTGIIRYPIRFEPVPDLNREFGMHFLLTVVTVGFYGIVWDYQLHNDPEKVYPEFHSAEDTVLGALRNTEMPEQAAAA